MSKRSMANGRRHVIIYEYMCNNCGAKMYVPRKKCCIRAEGHVKDMYCPKCQKKTEFTQVESL